MKTFMVLPTVPPIRRPSYGEPPAPDPSGQLTCDGCSHCCHYIAVEIDKPTSKADYDQVIWFLLHDGVSVWMDWESQWYVQFETTCQALSSDERCQIYEDRPKLCRDYTLESCVRHNEEPAEKLLFRTADDFIAWLEKKGVDWQFKSVLKQKAILRQKRGTKAATA